MDNSQSENKTKESEFVKFKQIKPLFECVLDLYYKGQWLGTYENNSAIPEWTLECEVKGIDDSIGDEGCLEIYLGE